MKEKIIKIISEQLGVPVKRITESSKLEDDLNGDSLDLIELAMWLEEEFGIEIDDSQFSKIVTVGDVINLVEKSK